MTLVAWVGLASCTPKAGTQWIDLPPLGAAKSLIISFEIAGKAPDVRFVDLARADEPIIPIQSVSAGEQVELEALLYSSTSTQLGLSPGPLQATTSATASRKLPTPLAGGLFHRSLGPHLDSAWTPSTTVSSVLASFRLPVEASTDCVRFDLEPRSQPSVKIPIWWTQLDADSALVGSLNQSQPVVIRVRDGAIDALTVSATLAAVLSGGRVDPGRQLWLLSQFGQLFRGGIDNNGVLTATLVSTAPEPTSFRWIDGDFDPSDLDLILLSMTGQLWRYDGRAWTKLLTFETPSGIVQWNGGVLRLGPHHVLAGIDSDPSIVSVVAGAVAPLPGLLRFEAVQAMSASPIGSVLAISAAPALFVYRDSGLTQLPNAFSPANIVSLLPFRSGVLGVSTEGIGQQYLPTGACPGVPSTLGHHGIAVLGLGPSVAFIGDDLRDLSSLDLTFARPRN
jgi:hypothetical protein